MHFSENITIIEEKIGYVFKDKNLLRQAFTRASFCNEVNHYEKIKYQSNEVLEFFGDSILSATIVTALIKTKSERYERGVKTSLDEGDFSNIRSKLADKKNLSDNIRRLELQKYLIMGEGDSKLGVENEKSVMEDLFESIIGAVYIDSDFNVGVVACAVERMLDLSVYLSKKVAPMQSYKNIIQEWCADKKRRMPPPIYEKIDEFGPDHNKTYVCVCIINGEIYGEGAARSIKLAEAAAAESALKKIGVI